MTDLAPDKTNSDTATMVHGTAIAINGIGVLLVGPSGSGKSDCALRLLDQGAKLISDDQTCLTLKAGQHAIDLSAPKPIKGLIEIRGIGLVTWDCVDAATLQLVIRACPHDQVPRMPDLASDDSYATFLQIRVREFQFDLRHAATPAKIKAALDIITGARRVIS